MAARPAILLGLCLLFALHAADAATTSTKKKNRKPTPATKVAPAAPPKKLISSLNQLPADKRADLQASSESPPADAPGLLDDGCSRTRGRITPCLGIGEQTKRSDVLFRFELSRSVPGAPKSALFGACTKTGSDACDTNADLQSDQEKLADMLNRGKRAPQANVGIELKF
ncbi:hypothetical protein [Viridibacterium curvum]|uniref:Uncharacterized protein n=1 Tax=Viridibacterium curvum TaxID=1101404 RepID=A0ABP9R1Z5_9RHOO